MREARFLARGSPVGPITLGLRLGERVARVYEEARDASIVAMMAAGIVKVSAGTLSTLVTIQETEIIAG